MNKTLLSLLIASLLLNCHHEKKVVVSFWHVMGGPVGRQLDELIAEFNRQHPEGLVESARMGSYDVLAQKLMGAVSSGTPPVIAQMYESWTDQFHAAGFLEPLDGYVRRDPGFQLEDFYPVFIEDNTYDAVLVTLPFNKSVPVFFYNRDLFRSAGLAGFPRDWAEYHLACEALKRRGILATSWPVDVWYFGSMLLQEGGGLYEEREREPRFDEPTGCRVLEYFVSLIRDSLLYYNPGFQRQDEFLAGNVAMVPASVVSWAFIKGRPSFDMAVAPFPSGTRPAVIIAGTNIGMFRSVSKGQKDLAWKFIRWFLEPAQQVRWTAASYYLPTRRSAAIRPDFLQFLKDNPGYDRVLAQLDHAYTEPRSAAWFTGRFYLTDALEEAARLEQTPEKALRSAARRMRVELK